VSGSELDAVLPKLLKLSSDRCRSCVLRDVGVAITHDDGVIESRGVRRPLLTDDVVECCEASRCSVADVGVVATPVHGPHSSSFLASFNISKKLYRSVLVRAGGMQPVLGPGNSISRSLDGTSTVEFMLLTDLTNLSMADRMDCCEHIARMNKC